MSFTSKLQVGLLTFGVLLLGWQFQQHLRRSRELAVIEAQVRSRNQELETGGAALAAVEQRNNELVAAERRAGNATLIALMRERAAATRSASEDTSELRGVGRALADVLDNPDQRTIDREQIRNQARAGSAVFLKLVHLTPEKADQYVELNTEMECRKAERLAALLQGRMTLDNALRERDSDEMESRQQLREILGEEGYAFYQSIADGMRADEAKRLLTIIQENMGDNKLNPEQGDRLKKLIQTEIANTHLDDTDLFRSPDDWAQVYAGHQENVMAQAAAFLTPAQLEALRSLVALDVAQKRDEMIAKRKSLGIK
jgi:hypothetical protein